ncbi:MAG: DUF2255 family protein [Anaerolineales bacterium]|nr:DUF2255 family protein [Anaerolineales bacterium]NUQ84812.1 DUF2255 family protein [Anaerolineales bacterium]
MKTKKRFPEAVLAAIHKERILGIRAGTDSTHRVIGIWAVVVEGRVFVRSWSLKPRSWWRTFLEDPYGEIFVGGRKRGIKVCAVRVRSEKMKEKVSAAYREKYNKPGDIQYVKDMSRKRSWDTTTELVGCRRNTQEGGT